VFRSIVAVDIDYSIHEQVLGKTLVNLMSTCDGPSEIDIRRASSRLLRGMQNDGKVISHIFRGGRRFRYAFSGRIFNTRRRLTRAAD